MANAHLRRDLRVVFNQMKKIAEPIITSYKTDLDIDEGYLELRRPHTFFWIVNKHGTYIADTRVNYDFMEAHEGNRATCQEPSARRFVYRNEKLEELADYDAMEAVIKELKAANAQR